MISITFDPSRENLAAAVHRQLTPKRPAGGGEIHVVTHRPIAADLIREAFGPFGRVTRVKVIPTDGPDANRITLTFHDPERLPTPRYRTYRNAG